MNLPSKVGTTRMDPLEPKSPGFFQSTFIKIMAAVISLAVTGAIGYFFASIKTDLAKIEPIESRVTVLETIQKSELIKNIDDLKETLKDYSAQFGAVSNDIKRIDILIARMEESLKALEKHK
jgi:septal ring factor EnvC (AmiA/AmiB activator)